jgi:heat shock protein HslJ
MRFRAGPGRGWLTGVTGVALATLLIACSSLGVDGRSLDGTHWRAISIAGRVPVAGFEPTLQFDNGRVSGSGGCNGYASQEAVTITGNRIVIGSTLSTLGRCLRADGSDGPLMPIEDAFMRTLSAVDHITFRDGDLVLSGGEGVLVFSPRP